MQQRMELDFGVMSTSVLGVFTGLQKEVQYLRQVFCKERPTERATSVSKKVQPGRVAVAGTGPCLSLKVTTG